jgi:hypothetical protein
MFKKIDDRSELFFSPIPRWITHTGFIILVCILLALVFASSYMRYPHTVKLPVILDGQKAYSHVSFTTFRALKQGAAISIDVPTSNVPLKGTLDINASVIEKDKMVVPVILNTSDLNSIRFRGEFHSRGEIVLENRSLLKKLLSRG